MIFPFFFFFGLVIPLCSVHRNCLGNLAVPRDVSIIQFIAFLFIHVPFAAFLKHEIPAQLLPAAMLLQPLKCTGRRIIYLEKIRLSVLVNSVDNFSFTWCPKRPGSVEEFALWALMFKADH